MGISFKDAFLQSIVDYVVIPLSEIAKLFESGKWSTGFNLSIKLFSSVKTRHPDVAFVMVANVCSLFNTVLLNLFDVMDHLSPRLCFGAHFIKNLFQNNPFIPGRKLLQNEKVLSL